MAKVLAAGAVLTILVPAATALASYGRAGGWGGAGSGNGQFSQPHGAAIDGSGNVHVADTGNARMQKFSSDGSFLAKWNGGLLNLSFRPYDVAVGPDGNIYTAGEGGVDVFNPSGGALRHWASANAYGIAVDGSGNVYVSDRGANRIRKYNATGSELSSWPATGFGMTAAGGGIYIADPANERIVKYGATGSVLGVWQMPTYNIVRTNGQPPSSGVHSPRDVAVDASGRVFAPDAGASSLVGVFSPSGALLDRFGSPDLDPFIPCWLSSPLGIAATASGVLHVVNTGHNRISIYSESGFPPCPPPLFVKEPEPQGDKNKPRVKLKGFPRRCTRRNFAFRIHVTDDVEIATVALNINGRKAGRGRVDAPQFHTKLKVPVRRIRRRIPRGYYVRFVVFVTATDSSGNKGHGKRGFRVCR